MELNRGTLGGVLRPDSLTVVVCLYLRLDIVALSLVCVVYLYHKRTIDLSFILSFYLNR
ncbi:hypothetical protein Hanom_Chr15g01346891 [Helianthus anomalus]